LRHIAHGAAALQELAVLQCSNPSIGSNANSGLPSFSRLQRYRMLRQGAPSTPDLPHWPASCSRRQRKELAPACRAVPLRAYDAAWSVTYAGHHCRFQRTQSLLQLGWIMRVAAVLDTTSVFTRRLASAKKYLSLAQHLFSNRHPRSVVAARPCLMPAIPRLRANQRGGTGLRRAGICQRIGRFVIEEWKLGFYLCAFCWRGRIKMRVAVSRWNVEPAHRTGSSFGRATGR